MIRKIKKIEFNPSKYTKDQLYEIYDTLNDWKWCDILGVKPEFWDIIPNYHTSIIKDVFLNSKSKIIKDILRKIVEIVGEKNLLEWHWIHNLGKTKKEYETWLYEEIANKFLSNHGL